MKKKILSILLAICMAMCLLPTGVFADGKAENDTCQVIFTRMIFVNTEQCANRNGR